MYEQWSWDQNPVNLTCIATAIPNATITWWVRDREINREIIDRNMEVRYPNMLAAILYDYEYDKGLNECRMSWYYLYVE